MKQIISKLSNFQDLSFEEIKEAFDKITNGEIPESQISAFLVALKMKGENIEERSNIAKVLQSYATVINTNATDIMDNCGTGGDNSHSFNISTTTSFVLASCDINVAKHGNRSISSKSGSADVLEELGINVEIDPSQLGSILEKTGIVFLFAKKMHPVMKYIMPARLSLGIPTIMNTIGPLIHPMNLETQLLGICGRENLEITATILKNLGRKRAVVVTGAGGMDEATPFGTNYAALLDNGNITFFEFGAKDLGIEESDVSSIKGGDAKENAKILISVLQNEKSPFLETTVLNAGLGFYANGNVKSIKEGVELARELIKSGKAYKKLTLLQENQK